MVCLKVTFLEEVETAIKSWFAVMGANDSILGFLIGHYICNLEANNAGKKSERDRGNTNTNEIISKCKLKSNHHFESMLYIESLLLENPLLGSLGWTSGVTA